MANRHMKRCTSLIIKKSNQNHNEIITSHLFEWLLSKRQAIGVGKDVEKREALCTVGRLDSLWPHRGRRALRADVGEGAGEVGARSGRVFKDVWTLFVELWGAI